MMEHFVRTLLGKDGQKIDVSISTPIREDGANGDWQCTYRIAGLGASKEKIAMGADGIQAFVLALTYLATALYLSDEFERGELTWQGGMTASDLGFPVTDSIREEVEKRKVSAEKHVVKARKNLT